MISKKDKILIALNNTNESIDLIALKLDTSKQYIKTIIRQHEKSI